MVKTIELFPPNLREDKNIQAFAEILDRVFSELTEEDLQKLFVYAIDSQPESVIDWLAWQFHVEGYELAKSLEEKRNLVKNAIELHRYKGTKYAIEKVLEALSLSGEIKEWFEYGGEPYKFKLYMKSVMSDHQLWNRLVSLVNEYKNERSWLDGIGIHREYTQNLFIGSALKNGKKYTIGLHFGLSVQKTTLYTGSVFRTGKKTSVGVHIPEVSISQSTLYCGSTLRTARKIIIGAANG
jgi:phage tail P2-like protein